MSVITKVVLYKHGVGYFEREAKVVGNAEVRLGFKTEEMNDVLKSLTVFDSAGGTVSSVSYDNQKPLARQLEESTLNIPSEGGGTALLGLVRGACVMVTAGSRMVTGQIVGVEEESLQTPSGNVSVARLSIFDDNGALHGFDLREVSTVRFLDEHLKSELKHLFETLLSATQRDTKNLLLFAKGEGERTLSISYVVECPVWKTSYRIAIADDDAEPPYLQGWALVDNPQDQDWKDVELSLVSGLPISFRHDLYSPRYLQRTEVEVEREAAAGPVPTEVAMRTLSAPLMMRTRAAAPRGGGGIGGLFDEAEGECFAAPAPSRAEKLSASQKVETVVQSVGQLFEYRIERPVTVLRNQSALVPIVGSPFEGRRKLLYNAGRRQENPFAVIDFRNTTGLTLEGGPLTVYEGDVYAGEAMLDTLSPQEERLVAYAVDLSVEAQRLEEHNEQVTLESLKDGFWSQRRARYTTITYRFLNKSAKAKELILEHEITPGQRVNTPEPVSETRNYWRFALTLAPEASFDFPIVVRLDQQSRHGLLDHEPARILALLETARSRPKLSGYLAKLSEMAAKLAELHRQELRVRQAVSAIGGDQERLRENLGKLGQSHDEARLRSRYVNELERQEDELASLAHDNAALAKERAEAAAELRDWLAGLCFEQAFE